VACTRCRPELSARSPPPAAGPVPAGLLGRRLCGGRQGSWICRTGLRLMSMKGFYRPPGRAFRAWLVNVPEASRSSARVSRPTFGGDAETTVDLVPRAWPPGAEGEAMTSHHHRVVPVMPIAPCRPAESERCCRGRRPSLGGRLWLPRHHGSSCPCQASGLRASWTRLVRLPPDAGDTAATRKAGLPLRGAPRQPGP